MSGLSDHLPSGRLEPPLGCGGGPRLDDSDIWARLQEECQDFSNNDLSLLSPDHFSPSSPSALSNGLHLEGRVGHGTPRHRQTGPAVDRLFNQTLRNMQTHMEPQGVPNSDVPLELSSTQETMHTTPSPLPLPLTVPQSGPASNMDTTEINSTFCPNSNAESSPILVEGEKKYALRSSGRPRFPCHLRKSSRLRRCSENSDKRTDGIETGPHEKVWTLKHEEPKIVSKVEQRPVEAVNLTPPCPTDIPLALTVPKPMPKPGPRLGHRPGPKSRCRPMPKPVHKAAPKSILRQRQAAQALAMARAATHVPFRCPAPRLSSSSVDSDGMPLNGRRRGRFTGVRRIVVKVARIPVSLSRRQKSYKISNLETFTVPEKTKPSEGSMEGSDPVREPTALLRMKNNGKSVMVMFPPGEMPVILKRRRGRPPKQAPTVLPGEPLPNPGTTVTETANNEPVKKPRRRRRTKLPCPFPSYVNDTNDVKTEYGDVLSKLAFLNRQPPATGRCSPPRCWTPSEPESFHTPLENPGISTLLHRLTGTRRPRGSRGGGMGRGGGLAGGIGGSERSKSTFSDFFESIGKKRKLSPVSEHGLPRKRGKGGHGRGGGVVGTEPGEKIVRKRRSRKNGAFKVDAMGQDWLNGAGGWAEDGFDKVKGLEGFPLCGSSRGGFSSCEVGRGGYSGSGRGAGPGDDSQGLFAGYFRSLLDSDDSSDLLDQSEHNKGQSNPGFEGSSLGMNPGFQKWSSKGGGGGEGASQMQCSTRPPYSYSSPAQMSPTRSTFPKSTPPSLSHSPSSMHHSSFGNYSPGFSSSPACLSQRSPDCSFAYGSGHNKSTPGGYYQAGPKRGFGGYHSGPNSPGGAYMSVAKGPFNSSSPDGFKQYNSNQWSYRQNYESWADGFGSQYHGYNEYGSNESKDILDISNYTPQKAKRLPFPESLSESSSDSSHLSSAPPGGGPNSNPGPYRHNEPHLPMSGEGGQSSLSSLEKLMMDWHESAAGPSYNWSQNVLFQGGGTTKPGRGRRKRTEIHLDKEHLDSPVSPSAAPGPKRGAGRGRGSRGGRGGLSPCRQAKGRGKAQVVSTGLSGTTEGLFHEGLDYYSGDSSSLSPLATPNPPPQSSYLQDPCEYTSPYPSTPSSEERYPALFPGESSSSLSPSVSSPPYPPKPTPPPPPQPYHPRTFSPSCSPSQRITPHCGTALSPSNRPPPKDFSQYDSPSYCSSPYWYGQHSGSPSPHSNIHAHTSPHGNSQGNPLTNMHVTPSQHDNTNMGSHLGSTQTLQHPNTTLSHSIPQNQTIPNAHLSPHANPSLHPTSGLYKERSPPSGMAPHTISQALRQGPMPLSPYPKPSVNSSPHQEDTGGYPMAPSQSFPGIGHRYPSQAPPGSGVLCQLLDQANDDSFSVTSL